MSNLVKTLFGAVITGVVISSILLASNRKRRDTFWDLLDDAEWLGEQRGVCCISEPLSTCQIASDTTLKL